MIAITGPVSDTTPMSVFPIAKIMPVDIFGVDLASKANNNTSRKLKSDLSGLLRKYMISSCA